MDRTTFRAKSKKDGLWVYGLPIRRSEGVISILEDIDTDLNFVEVDPKTLCRCLGEVEYDYDHKRIVLFGGDILELTFYMNDGADLLPPMRHRCLVMWNQGDLAWLFQDFETGKWENTNGYVNVADDIEVIGNMFDNPDMLPAKEKSKPKEPKFPCIRLHRP